MAQITYEDKVAINENPQIPNINKCNATDLNEIKNVVNENAPENTISNTHTTGTNKTYSANYINALEKDAIKMYLSSNQTIPAQTYTKINLVKEYQKSNKFTISNNSIVIPEGVTDILVSANIYWYTGSNHADGKIARIYKNDTSVVAYSTRFNANYIYSFIPATYLKVQAGDVISLRLNNDRADTDAIIGSGSPNTYLSVIEI